MQGRFGRGTCRKSREPGGLKEGGQAWRWGGLESALRDRGGRRSGVGSGVMRLLQMCECGLSKTQMPGRSHGTLGGATGGLRKEEPTNRDAHLPKPPSSMQWDWENRTLTLRDTPPPHPAAWTMFSQVLTGPGDQPLPRAETQRLRAGKTPPERLSNPHGLHEADAVERDTQVISRFNSLAVNT